MLCDWLSHAANSREKCFFAISSLVIAPRAILVFSKCNTAKFRKDDWLSCKSIAIGIDFSPLRISLKERIRITILFQKCFAISIVVMNSTDIRSHLLPAVICTYKPGVVYCFCQIIGRLRKVLLSGICQHITDSPGFVKRNPCHNAGIIIQL